jgi:hydroxymethylglutaryl-CoA lyase
MPPVRITDVSPRDGLQNERITLPTRDKVRLVELLCAANVDEVEVTSFVSPRWVPQLADAADVLLALRNTKPPGLCFSALVPNEKGLDAALDVNQRAGSRLIDKVSLFAAASETFSKRNTNGTISEVLTRFEPALNKAAAAGLSVRLYISCVVACPFEGAVAPTAVVSLAQRLLALAANAQARAVELDLGDTIGAATPESLAPVLTGTLALPGWSTVAHDAPFGLVLHLHDTFGRAAACVTTALRLGVRSFDGSVAGLGGCPYAGTPDKPAPGNIDTLTLVRAVHAAGHTTRVNLPRLEEAARFARSLVTPRPAQTEVP